ncbi:prenyltransferase/squalene oxidase repeat-containing protein [Micromonospora mirobrigensis]|uniref:Prenyltransferase and squalene oxidase repeat-containing protein n=1 Tax=Micromonospora mirobrigensis TaxID=262898 RepID=A0A1C5AND8_9ACTN|nr:prenyltransferase/squalene oxidase repeat-containing protein [Micromonospora mirobrigensis]SCF46740.1 Prenyltransferase and squalene oxidase repeat-containing protein [Micromonospora mirobrigensis]
MTAAPQVVPGVVPGDPGSAVAARHAEARELVRALARHPAGSVRPSVYETARVVSDAPWLPGHAERLGYLLTTQSPDGAWGAPGTYALVPTVSAVEALLRTAADRPRHAAQVTPAAARGLAALRDRLLVADEPVPDLPGADLIVPALLDRIDALRAGDAAPAGPLPLPRGMTRRRTVAVDALLASGRPLPQKLWHAFEVLGARAGRGPGVRLLSGAVGASPAATAAWLGARGGPDAEPAALRYLTRAVGEQGGPVPCTTPIAVFERAWVLAGLARVGAVRAVPADLLTELAGALGPTGAATSPGLPTDADTTAVVLYALARLGRPVAPDSLLAYDTGAHFCTWQGEDGISVSTNAHVLEALGRHGPTGRYGAVARRVADWLVGAQRPDGSWTDRWHASAYYATAGVAVSLAGYAPATAAGALDRAVRWVLATQRPDGSWGRWGGTAEETAYALHVLLATGRATRPGVAAAVRRAVTFLDADRADLTAATGLWHDKDLYHPVLIVRAAVVAARWLAAAAGPVRPRRSAPAAGARVVGRPPGA